jgi:RNA polymerase sigma-70 factor (ECF subfamily)
VGSSNLQWRLSPAPQPSAADGTSPGASDNAADAAAPPDARHSDLQLVQQLVSGDADSWKSFVQRFGRLVLTRVIASLREMNQPLAQQDTEDLCADVFSHLVTENYAVLRRFEGRSTLSTWLTVVTRRIVIRRLSVAWRQPARATAQSATALDSLPNATGDDPLAALIGREDRDALAAAVADLTDRDRQLAYLFYIDGCSYREISSRLQMPVNSIGPTLARLHDKLRAAMKPKA